MNTGSIPSPHNQSIAIGLHRLVEENDLRVPLPALRSEAVSGARKTYEKATEVIEQYPASYAPKTFGGICVLPCATSLSILGC